MSEHRDQSPDLSTQATIRDQIGVSIAASDAPTLIAVIEEADAAGVRNLWMTQTPVSADSLTVYAAALGRTKHVRLGTSIVPTYPRHPLALAQQAATVASLGPGRLRLGVGPSHRPAIESVYGMQMVEPLSHLREYVAILRDALWEGTVDRRGRFFTANATLPHPPLVPILVSALGAGAFQLAGEISDGAISWNCPPSYLLDVALPALRRGAEDAGRPVPPLVAHAWVALTSDIEAVRAAARKRLGGYARLPFYANMFEAAGFPVQNGTVSDALIDTIVVMGDESVIAGRLAELLDSGLDELLLTIMPLEDEAGDRTRLLRLVGRM